MPAKSKKIHVELSDGKKLDLTPEDADLVMSAIKIHYYREDVMSWLDEHSDEFRPEIFNDMYLINTVTSRYAKYRTDSDGGEYEALAHWTDCLDRALGDYSDMLDRYRLNN